MRMRNRLQAAGEDARRAIVRSGFPLAPAACTRDFLAGLVFAAAMLAPAAAHAIPYFNAPPVEGMSFGFDQDALAEPLPIDVDVPLDAGFPPVVFTTPGGAGGGER